MFKSAFFTLLVIVSVQSFAPMPAINVQRTSLSTPLRRNPILLMAGPATEEKYEIQTGTVNDEQIKKDVEEEKTEELSQTQKLMKQVKESGTAGIVSYALWELAFWFISVPVCVFGYRELTGHWPDLSNTEDLEKLGAEAFAFVNFARFAVPLRIGLALSTTPWIQKNVIDRFQKDEEKKDANE